MKFQNRPGKPAGFWFSIAALLMLTALAVTSLSFGQPAAAFGDVTATYSQGSLRVSIPYAGLRRGSGQLIVELLDPEDQVAGHSEQRVDINAPAGLWKEEIKPAKPLPLEDVVWRRVRYRFAWTDRKDKPVEGIVGVSQILRTPVVHVFGQQTYLAGAQAAVRIIATDSKNEAIEGPGSIRVDLSAAEGKPAQHLFTGPLDRRGTADAQFRVPPGLAGGYTLRYVVDTPIGSAEFTQPIRIEDKVSVLLTAEKPIYQPGQTIHARALALDRSNHDAAAGRKLAFELDDSRGNKIFWKATQTSKFGVASAEFTLADEVNLGAYHLRALMDGTGASALNTAEITLNVERYVLPKFKVAVDLSSDNGKAKHGYRPGDHVTGTVRANYFFGNAVAAAECTVKASGMDVAQFDAGSVHGKTDRDGAYRFDIELPKYFVGRPLNHGAARVLIEAGVKDSAGHTETRGEPITVSESPLILTAVPESGALIPDLENQVFVLASYAEGKPAAAEIKAYGGGNAEQTVATDAAGVAVIRLKAGAAAAETLHLEASDKEGNRASASVPLQIRGGEEHILLRTDRAIYRAGDRILLKVFSTKERGSVYIDAVREGQTVLTRDVDLADGHAELSFTANADLAGALDFSAYIFGRNARPVADHRLVFIEPADELKIETTADAVTYKPGQDAHMRFRVTNARGEGVQAALGVQAVDEAVFALAEKQPGFAKVFFYLEKEALKPRYEIHSIGMPEVITSTRPEQDDRAARALFSAAEFVNRNRFETEFGRTPPMTKYAEYWRRYRTRFDAQVRQFAESLNRAWPRKGADGDLVTVAAELANVGEPSTRDAWDNTLRVEHAPWNPQSTLYLVRSAGPDKRFGTPDDLMAYVTVHARQVAGPSAAAEWTIKLEMEHDRGPFNGLAEIAGMALDSMGAPIGAASVNLRETSSRKTRAATAAADGRFSLSGVPPGEYEIRIESRGFTSASRKSTLKERDRAVLSATLSVGSVNQTVEVMAAPGSVRFAGNAGMQQAARGEFDVAGVAGGVPGGIGGGIGGGIAGGVVGGIIGGLPSAAPSIPVPRARQMVMDKLVAVTAASASIEPDRSVTAARVRSYFPEALYINPEIITDQSGKASIEIPLADSITTWRLALTASTIHGALGTGSGSIKVFQDFFADLDLPVTLTQGDRVSIPVAVYNYSGASGSVSLHLKNEDWFSLVDDAPDKNVAVESGRVGGSQYTIEARRIGKFKLTLSARMQGVNGRADIVVREIEVIPNGREQSLAFNGRLENSVQHELNFPAASIPGASRIFVRLYPGPLSEIIEGMDAILRMPFGCFEQTSSSTYPNVLALDYMKRTKKLTPEIHARAEGFIATGYQRLLAFEVPGGGFSWFGQAPANKILTAYGLMEFSDMSKIHDVDRKVIERTQQWLASQQQPDGSWKPDAAGIHEGATNRFTSDVSRITAYIAWSLENTGYRGPAVEKAREFVAKQLNANLDAYTLAVLANFVVDYGKDRDLTREAMSLLIKAASEKDGQISWAAEETGFYARGASAAVEATGLALQALLKWGGDPNTARKALNYIVSKKDASGTWGTTQATIMALRALLLSVEKVGGDVRGTVQITLNGKPAGQIALTSDNNDLLHQLALQNVNANGANSVTIRFDGKGSLAYQVAGRYFVPWNEKAVREPLSIDVAYDRTRLLQDDIATATATIKSNLDATANMVMVDLGIPPGFDLMNEDLQSYQEKTASQKDGRLEKFSQTATQAILYFNSIARGSTITLRYRLRAKYPIRARTFFSRVYEYYDPEVSSVARPIQLEVRKR